MGYLGYLGILNSPSSPFLYKLVIFIVTCWFYFYISWFYFLLLYDTKSNSFQLLGLTWATWGTWEPQVRTWDFKELQVGYWATWEPQVRTSDSWEPQVQTWDSQVAQVPTWGSHESQVQTWGSWEPQNFQAQSSSQFIHIVFPLLLSCISCSLDFCVYRLQHLDC